MYVKLIKQRNGGWIIIPESFLVSDQVKYSVYAGIICKTIYRSAIDKEFDLNIFLFLLLVPFFFFWKLFAVSWRIAFIIQRKILSM